MKTNTLVLALAASGILSLGAVALAQSDHGHGELPAICTSSGMPPMDQMGMDSMMGGMDGMDPAHQDMMMGMGEMHAGMMQGMMAADIDVAFVCGMIPHHQGAIDMARAVLAHGKDPIAKRLAQEIAATQQAEIELMHRRLEELPQLSSMDGAPDASASGDSG